MFVKMSKKERKQGINGGGGVGIRGYRKIPRDVLCGGVGL